MKILKVGPQLLVISYPPSRYFKQASLRLIYFLLAYELRGMRRQSLE